MITVFQIHLSVGSVLWLLLDWTGVIDNTLSARSGASPRAAVIATVMMIALWPWFVWEWVRGMRA